MIRYYWSCDGASHKSSSYSSRPIRCVINEVSPNVSFRITLVEDVWFEQRKLQISFVGDMRRWWWLQQDSNLCLETEKHKFFLHTSISVCSVVLIIWNNYIQSKFQHTWNYSGLGFLLIWVLFGKKVVRWYCVHNSTNITEFKLKSTKLKMNFYVRATARNTLKC